MPASSSAPAANAVSTAALNRCGADKSRTTSLIVVTFATASAGSTAAMAARTDVVNDAASTSPFTAIFMFRHSPPIGLASPPSAVSEYGE